MQVTIKRQKTVEEQVEVDVEFPLYVSDSYQSDCSAASSHSEIRISEAGWMVTVTENHDSSAPDFEIQVERINLASELGYYLKPHRLTGGPSTAAAFDRAFGKAKAALDAAML